MKLSFIAVLLIASLSFAQTPSPTPAPTPQYPNYPSETPADFKPATSTWDYERREAEIPMRDGVKLHTVILVPKSATKSAQAAILLTRTPYNADELTSYAGSPHLGPIIAGYDNAVEPIVEGGYIRVVQDVRGKYGSEGDYVMNRPLHGPLNPTPVDHSTDTWDTIDWLVKNVPECNGRVGILGISYDGFLPLMALINPHPALKVSVPMNPMVDGWRGDDWFHNGAFRQMNLPYIYEQTATRKNEAKWWSGFFDDYDLYLSAGSAGQLARIHGMDQLLFWKKVTEHPAYDSFWQQQAMDKLLAAQPLKVPVMLVDSLWDQEDIYGAMAVYKAIKPKDTDNSKVFLVIGPWHHGQEIGDGRTLGALRFDSDTALYFRQQILRPFLDRYLKGTDLNTRVEIGGHEVVRTMPPGVGIAESGWQLSTSTPQPSGEGAPGARQVIGGVPTGTSSQSTNANRPSGTGVRPSGTGMRYNEVSPVTAYETGTNTWRRLPAWPPTDNGACAVPCVPKPTPLYLQPGLGLSFSAPAPPEARGLRRAERPEASGPYAAYTEYVSDPAKPVPFRARPTRPVGYDIPKGLTWPLWLVDDQREASGRPDVLAFTSDVLTAPVKISGQPIANLVASTTGTDSDWVVKLIDVYPDQVALQPEMGGYQLMVSADIFRGRYRESLETAKPIAANVPLLYRFELPTANHVFLPGHRIMVQVQSSWFPLYDRNPQSFVPNIFFAQPADYHRATQRIYHSPEKGQSSFIELPLVTP